MKSLQNYLFSDLQLSEEKLHSLSEESLYNGLQELLETCYIVRNSRVFELPQALSCNDHRAVVNQCILFLLDHQLFNNVLSYGYSIARNRHVNNPLHCVSINTQVAKIKGPLWQMIYRLIGTQNFADILINHTVMEFNGLYFTQIVGNRMNEPHSPPSWCQNSEQSVEADLLSPISMRKVLYHNSLEMRATRIFLPGATVNDLSELIFERCWAGLRNSTRKKITPILQKLLVNSRNNKDHSRILDNICPKAEVTAVEHHLELKTENSKVLRFLIIILEKLIPPEMFGSKRNKSILFSKISLFLDLTPTGNLKMEELLMKLRVKDFAWLRSDEQHFSKHDFEYSSQLVRHFVYWFFDFLVSEIVAKYFYCTEVSSGAEVYYFRHDVWNSISLPFLSKYFASHLIENRVCRNHESYLLSNYNHNKFRVVPKKAKGEFRVITVPYKGFDEEECIKFKENLRQTVIPAQCVLEYLRNKRKTSFQKLYSVSQIVNHIRGFKDLLIKKYQAIPTLHFMKFDMESCYDTIPRQKLMAIISQLLKDESGFFIRSQTIFNPSNNSLKTSNVVNGSKKPAKDEIYIDNVRTIHLSNDDLVNIIQLELYKTALSFSGKCFLRKDGLFQGASFSALLVDIIYDDLLMNYDAFQASDDEEKLILRLADDFLIITNKKNQIAEIRNIALNGFDGYNARIKVEKMIYTDNKSDEIESIHFCALNISLKELEVWKSPDSLEIPKIPSLSSKKAYQKLLRFFEMKLSYGTTSSEVNSIPTILNQIECLSISIANGYAINFRRNLFIEHRFEAFFEALFTHALSACVLAQQDSLLREQIRWIIADCFLHRLQKYPKRFGPAIAYLKRIANLRL